MPPHHHDQSNAHLPVHWLDTPLPPTRWERLSTAWRNLPAALIVGLIVIALIVPQPTLPSVSVPEISLPAIADGDDDTAELAQVVGTPAAPPPATPVGTPLAAEPASTAATPAPEATPAPVETAVASTTVEANELGRVPIIMYHAFVTDPAYTDEWTLTFDQFRAQLDWFRENDFVMVGMQSMVDGRFDLPAGKKPVILTFDDSNAGQFGLQEAAGGGYELKPNTAVGVIEAYGEEYPEFVGPAFFGVLPFNCFESDDDPSTCEERLDWLVERGYEIGNHTSAHGDLTDVPAETFVQWIADMTIWINERLPEGPGNLADVLVLPYGAYPADPDQRSWLSEGFWYQGEPFQLDIVLGVNGGPAISPYSQKFFGAETYRIASDPGILAYWQEQMLANDPLIFVSDGDPDTVTIPASWIGTVDQDKLQRLGLQLSTWDDE